MVEEEHDGRDLSLTDRVDRGEVRGQHDAAGGPLAAHIWRVETQHQVEISGVVSLEHLSHDLHVLLRHRLPPFLREAFGGSTGLVDVGGRKASDRASHPEVDPSLALSNMAGAANQTPVLNRHCKHNPIAEVTDLLKLVVQFLVGPEPVLKEATYRRSTLDEVRPPRPRPHLRRRRAHHPVEITAIQQPQTACAQAPPGRGSWTPQASPVSIADRRFQQPSERPTSLAPRWRTNLGAGPLSGRRVLP